MSGYFFSRRARIAGTAASTRFRSRSSIFPKPVDVDDGRDQPRVYAPIDLREDPLERPEPVGQTQERLPRQRRALGRADGETVNPLLEEEPIERGLVLQVQVLLSAPHAIERWLRDVEVPASR